jgi:hypothetical protein
MQAKGEVYEYIKWEETREKGGRGKRQKLSIP